MDEAELMEKITQLESENATYKADIETLKGTIATKETKISELQTYICKNLTTPKDPNTGSTEIKNFATMYKETLSLLKEW